LSADSCMDDLMRDIQRFLSRLINEKHSDIANKGI
jgi:hypothetical protein